LSGPYLIKLFVSWGGPQLDQVWDFVVSLHSMVQIELDYGLVTQCGLDYGWIGHVFVC
jgi:hypothetical protein